ncbi:VWA domain-containing protein [Candidatus Parcubacteria bacterium]|nr:VWA domain-containing protein [Candidatus Parcubacteria bacterium]
MKKVLSIPIVTLILGYLQVNKVLAQSDILGVNGMTDTVLGTRGIEDTVASIINIVLGLLGIIAVVLIIYGGFLWMTSKGNTDQVQRAKMVIISAVIGLVIILSAYAITRFVLGALENAVGPGGGTPQQQNQNPGGALCPPPLNPGAVEVCDPFPSAATVGSAFTVGAWNIGPWDTLATSFVQFNDLAGNTAVAEIASCGANGYYWNLLYTDINTGDDYYEIRALVPALPVSLPNYDVEVHNINLANPFYTPAMQFAILSGSPAPSIFCIQPSHAATSTAVSIIGRGLGVGGQALDEIFVNAYPGGVHQPQFPVPGPVPGPTITNWADDQIDFIIPDQQISGNVTVQVDDGAGNSDTSNPVYFIVDCTNDGECASGCCPGSPGPGVYACSEEVVCTGISSAPHITAINPDNGTDGNIVTVFGYNFCDDVACAPGTVWFTDGANNPVAGILPSTLNAQCGDFWTDTAIIIGVPPTVDTGQVTMETAAAVASDNAITFTENNIEYPGICALQDGAGNPITTGFFDDGIPVHVHGIRFNNNDRITFGGFLGYNPSYLGLPTEVQADVPNSVGIADVVVTSSTEATIVSNPFPFSALAVTGGLPTISEISPTSTRIGKYTTIMGANFGTTPGDVEFWQLGVHIDDGEFTFPAQCGSHYWQHDSIVVKPPTDLILNGGNYGDFDVVVRRSGDNATSLPHPVEILAGPPGPGICLMQPDNGPAGKTINFYGDNFNTAAGAVVFHNNEFADLTNAIWGNQQVLTVPVPNNAATGPVFIRDSAGMDSNDLMFSVGACSSDTQCQNNLQGNICCPDTNGNFCDNYLGCSSINECTYGWRFTTESLLQVVGWGPVCDDSCINGTVWVDFNTEIVAADLDFNNFSILECTDSTCQNTNPGNFVTAASTFTQPAPAAAGDPWVVSFTHNAFNPNTYYLVEVNPNIQNTDGAILGNPHSWSFATGANNCDVDHINVAPASRPAYIGDVIPFGAQAYSPPSSCYPAGQPIACDAAISCSWSAWTNDGAYTTQIPTGIPESMDISADAVTLVGGTQIGAEAVQGANTFNDFGVLDITVGPNSLLGLNRQAYGPTCSDSCLNGDVWIEFDSEVTVNEDAAHFSILECTDSTCQNTVGPNQTNSTTQPVPAAVGDPWRVELNHNNFSPNTYYLVTIDGNIANNIGPLVGGTFTWSFGAGDAACDVGNLLVSPAIANVNIGDTVHYSAQPYSAPGICYPSGQAISCDAAIGCSWNAWTNDGAYTTQIPIAVDNIDILANNPTPAVGTPVGVGVTQGATTFSGVGTLNIGTGGASVFSSTGHGPTCSDSCINGLVHADFNEEPDFLPSTRIYQCDDATCTATSGPSLLVGTNTYQLMVGGDWRVRLFHTPFTPGVSYQAYVDGGTYHTYASGDAYLGNALMWSFGTGVNSCDVDRADIYPPGPDPILSTVNLGDNISYSVETYSVPGICYPGGQPIVCDASIGCILFWNANSQPGGLVNITTAQDTDSVTYNATTVGNNDTVRMRAVQNATQFLDATDVDVVTGVLPGSPNIVDHEPVALPVCINAAPTVVFDQLMDSASINSNVKVYRTGTPGPNCISPGNPTLCEVPGSFTLVADSAIPETRAIFNPDTYLATSTNHYLYVGPNTQSLDGQSLGWTTDLAFSMLEVTGDGVVDGLAWMFPTNQTVCQLSHAIITPTYDFFHCSLDDCDENDVAPGGNNEHRYTAVAYGVDGSPLNVSNYWWTNSDPSIFTIDSQTTQQIMGWPGFDNGHVTLSVSAWDNDPAITGTVGAAAGIEIFLCENPWPSANTVPWEPGPPPNPYHYSTLYCLDDGDGGFLPYLDAAVSATNPNPNGVLNAGERIFIINPSSSMGSLNLAQYQFGSLAYGRELDIDNNLSENKSWFEKIRTALWGDVKKAEGQANALPMCAPGNPTNLQVSSVDDTQVTLTWGNASSGVGPNGAVTNYNMYRREIPNGNYPGPLQGTINVPGQRIFTDNTVVTDTIYEYTVTAEASACPAETFPVVSTTVTASISQPHVDIIGLRVMGNDEHLSITDWYKQHAPNPEVLGEIKEIDGYEAMQVGNTTYIGALNMSGLIYTNVYIISHNIGASGDTRDIYKQFIENMKFNTNMPRLENVCNADTSIICSSDFDCPVGDYCTSRDLKIKRDLQRLGDLMNVKNMVEEYGQSHKACSHNSAIACVDDSPCILGGGTCVSYYPLLNAGTFVNGMSNSNWPSWNTTLRTILGEELPEDPIGLFNGCPPGADPDTCWDELVSPPEFTCPAESLIYFYNNDVNVSQGIDYFLGANFEYDSSPALHFDPSGFNPLTFGCDLYNGPASITGIWPDPACPVPQDGMPHIYSSLDSLCSVASVYSPGAVTIPSCGNGTWEPDGVDGVPNTPDDEICEPGMQRNLCIETVVPLGTDWWDAGNHIGGCNPVGTEDAGGNLIECTWYEPDPALTAVDCGGYCGNNTIDPVESCDGAAGFDGLYTCYDPDTMTTSTPVCNINVCQAFCPTGNLASLCGDGAWDASYEQCDASADPSGLVGWDCGVVATSTVACNNCAIECTIGGTLYNGVCGNDIIEWPEECEPGIHIPPTAATSSPTYQYLCDPTYCVYDGGYCADGINPGPYDSGGNTNEVAILIDGSAFYQPEECDDLEWDIPQRHNSDQDYEYLCNSCVIEGGYCGDGNRDSAAGISPSPPEECDDGNNSEADVCTNACEWGCEDVAIGPFPRAPILAGYISSKNTDDGLLFNTTDATVELHAGDSATLPLGSCRISGDVVVDVTVHGNDSYAGIVFVVDRSSSMSGDIAAAKNAIGSAIVTIFDRNPTAQIAIVEYGDDAWTRINFTGFEQENLLIGSFRKTGAIGGAVNQINADRPSTDHSIGLDRAYGLFNATSFENNIVIFMTDGSPTGGVTGNCVNGANVGDAYGRTLCIAENDLKFCNNPAVDTCVDMFTVAFTSNVGLQGFLNAVSSSDCVYSNYGRSTTGGTCGSNGIECLNTLNQREECDGGPDCISSALPNACQWSGDRVNDNRAYSGSSQAELAQMYQDISGSIPINNVLLALDNSGATTTLNDIGVTFDNSYRIHTNGIATCSDGSTVDNELNISANFTGNINAYLELSNPVYEFCHWYNCPWCFNN